MWLGEGEVKSRPILFSGEMVNAILQGRKSQTRRVIRDTDVRDHRAFAVAAYVTSRPVRERGRVIGHRDVIVSSPFGQPGDRLWVRETWRVESRGVTNYLDYAADTGAPDMKPVALPEAKAYATRELKYRPSIHMPRWASRITLEVTGVRVERLNDCSAPDALAEGVEEHAWHGVPIYKWRGVGDFWNDPREAFREGWDSINGKRPGCAWKDSPWVWVVEFRRVT